jgi:hypothetical protein
MPRSLSNVRSAQVSGQESPDSKDDQVLEFNVDPQFD